MNEIKLDVRLVQLHNTFAYWLSHSDFVPLDGEVVVYTNRKAITDTNGQVINIPDFKIGDGTTTVGDLPFLVGTDDEIQKQLDELAAKVAAHIADAAVHIQTGEREKWNEGMSCTMDEETLVITKIN